MKKLAFFILHSSFFIALALAPARAGVDLSDPDNPAYNYDATLNPWNVKDITDAVMVTGQHKIEMVPSDADSADFSYLDDNDDLQYYKISVDYGDVTIDSAYLKTGREDLSGAMGDSIAWFNGSFFSITAANSADNDEGGGAIYNNGSVVGDIIGDFYQNYVEGDVGVDAYLYGGAIYNNTGGAIGSITGNFLENYVTGDFFTFGGALHNRGVIGDMEGDFIGNYALSNNSFSAGGAIYNIGTIGGVTGVFIGNRTQSLGGGNAHGGAIYNYAPGSVIGDIIEGAFEYNGAVSADNGASGGAIYNRGQIGDMTGNFLANNFVGNYAKTLGGGAASGGAIYNDGAGAALGIIGSRFIDNYAESGTGSASGGAIYNSNGTIGGITGDNFAGNYVKSLGGGAASGGAIFNSGGTIGDIAAISGPVVFFDNYAASDAGNAAGGAIYNYAPGSVIGDIKGIFTDNSAQSLGNGSGRGGAIYNSGTIGDITGTFGNNTAVASNNSAFGGAIFNSNGTIGDITGDFMNNKAQGSGLDNVVRGGAIYNYGTGTLGIISASFTGNGAESQSASPNGGSAYGGAIYTDKGLDFSADAKDIEFTGNWTKDASRGKVYNAIFIGYIEPPSQTKVETIKFDAKTGRKITVNDQMEGGGNMVYDVLVTGAGTTYLNNFVIGAKEVRVENSTLRLGSKTYADAAAGQGQGHGLFVPAYSKTGYSNYTPGTDLILDGGFLVLDYSSAQTLRLKELTMKNESAITLLNSNKISAVGYNFYGANEIVGNMDFRGSNLSFYIPSNTATDPISTMLGVLGSVNVAGLDINVGIDGASSPFEVGDKVYLIDSLALIASDNTLKFIQGVSLIYDADLDVEEDKKLVLTVKESGATGPTDPNGPNGSGAGTLNPQTKSFSEGAIAGFAFANQAADFVASAGTSGMVKAAREAGFNGSPVGVFATAATGRSKYETGSRIEVQGTQFVGGFATSSKGAMLGGFVEYGNGKYDAFNEVEGEFNGDPLNDVTATGKMDYAGGGVMLRLGAGALYMEGALRGGVLNASYESGDLIGLQPGQIAEFEAKTQYYGGHAGLGFVFAGLMNDSEFEGSVKYISTTTNAFDAKVSSGETVKFEKMTSAHIRGTGRLTVGTGDVRPYIEGGYNYEPGTEARAEVLGKNIEAPELRGATMFGGAGVAIEGREISLILGGEYYGGLREGWGLSAMFKYRLGSTGANSSATQSQNQTQTQNQRYGSYGSYDPYGSRQNAQRTRSAEPLRYIRKTGGMYW
ncbi:MAG: hypothetical protein LBQ49_01830 [Rickettsiales bacterium]|jgi:hypothetical protein|nr:hypothetical protein [Rickettsiales bacterium]